MWLGGILVVLVVLIFALKPPDKTDDDFTKVFADVEPSAVHSITLTRGGVTATLERADDGWKMTAPIGIDADSRRVDTLVGSLVRLEAREAMPGATPADFGLDPAKVHVEATLADDKKLTLDIGADTPVGSGTYISDSTGIRSTRAKLSTTFDKDPTELRTHELVAFSRSEVDRIDIAHLDGAPLVLVHDTHGWWVGADRVLHADDDAVSRFLDALLGLRVDAFGEGPIAPPTFPTTVTVHTGDTSHTLVIGAPDAGRAVVIGPIQPAPVLVTLPDLPFDRPASGWASTRLMPVHIATLDTLDVALGDQTLEATRADTSWQPAQGDALPNAIGEVRVDRAVQVPPPGAEWGHITLSEGDTRTETVRVFQEVEGGGRVASDEAGGQPFLLPATELGRLLGAMTPKP